MIIELTSNDCKSNVNDLRNFRLDNLYKLSTKKSFSDKIIDD